MALFISLVYFIRQTAGGIKRNAMRAIVTGGDGFIGSHLVEELLKRGMFVSTLHQDTCGVSGPGSGRTDSKWLENCPVNRIDCRADDKQALSAALDGCDYVFHVDDDAVYRAAHSRTHRGRAHHGQPHLDAADNDAADNDGRDENPLTLLEKLLDAVSAHAGALKRFVYVSGISAAGPGDGSLPACPRNTPSPVTETGRIKLAAEQTIRRRAEKIPFTIIRPAVVYGPRDARQLYPIFRFVKRGLFPYWQTSNHSIIYVEDLARGVADCVGSHRTVGNTYYLSSPEPCTNRQLAGAIARALSCSFVRFKVSWKTVSAVTSLLNRLHAANFVDFDRLRELNYENWLCACDEARNDFGFETSTGLVEGIAWTANWYKMHKWL
jgi:nucleoside-diphosphate-sugar epimerase